MNIKLFNQLLDKWSTSELSKNELIELEKHTKKLLSAVKINLILTEKQSIHIEGDVL